MKDTKAIDTSIKSIKTAGAKLDALIQTTACEVLEHFQTHRDTGLVNRLFLALPKGSRGIALADWLLKFVAVKLNTNKETKADQPFVFDKDKVETMMAPENMVKAKATVWTDLKREKPLDEAFDVMAGFKSLLRKIEHSAQVKHFDREALVAFGKAVGVPESDIPTKPGLKAKSLTAPAGVPAASM